MCINRRNHFRANNSKDSRGHPAYIYQRVGDKYKFIGITHSEITQHKRNIKLAINPNPNDERTSYARPFTKEEHIKKFGPKKKGWKLGKINKKIMKNIIKKN